MRWSERTVYRVLSVRQSDFDAVSKRLGVYGMFGDHRFADAYDTDYIIADEPEDAIKDFHNYYGRSTDDEPRFVIGVIQLGYSIEARGDDR